jgi:hypothetical protein
VPRWQPLLLPQLPQQQQQRRQLHCQPAGARIGLPVLLLGRVAALAVAGWGLATALAAAPGTACLLLWLA